MNDIRAMNPQTDSPSESLGKLRGKISPNSTMDIRDQIREYSDLMGSEALTRQMKLARAKNGTRSKARRNV